MSVYSEDFKKMKWAEFCSLLSGLGENTPLARVVQIRLESDPEVIKTFTSAQHRIRNKWQSRHKVKRGKAELDSFLREIQSAFAAM